MSLRAIPTTVGRRGNPYYWNKSITEIATGFALAMTLIRNSFLRNQQRYQLLNTVHFFQIQ